MATTLETLAEMLEAAKNVATSKIALLCAAFGFAPVALLWIVKNCVS